MRRGKQIMVVETYDGRAYLGRLEYADGSIKVLSGYNGRPPVLDLEDVSQITSAAIHPDVVFE